MLVTVIRLVVSAYILFCEQQSCIKVSICAEFEYIMRLYIWGNCLSRSKRKLKFGVIINEFVAALSCFAWKGYELPTATRTFSLTTIFYSNISVERLGRWGKYKTGFFHLPERLTLYTLYLLLLLLFVLLLWFPKQDRTWSEWTITLNGQVCTWMYASKLCWHSREK